MKTKYLQTLELAVPDQLRETCPWFEFLLLYQARTFSVLINETIQHSDHEKPLLVGYSSEIIFLKYTACSCSPGWWIFKPELAWCFGSSPLDLWACFLHISLLLCPLPTCWISGGSDAFLCSAFTWMHIHTSLTSAGISRTWRLRDEARNLTAVPSLST